MTIRRLCAILIIFIARATVWINLITLQAGLDEIKTLISELKVIPSVTCVFWAFYDALNWIIIFRSAFSRLKSEFGLALLTYPKAVSISNILTTNTSILSFTRRVYN